MECLEIKQLIINKNKKKLLDKYIELVNSKRINPLIVNKLIYNILNYLPEDKRIKASININFNNDLEYWMLLASPLLKEYFIK